MDSNTGSRFYISYWCPDCCGEDMQGCFNGQSLRISIDDFAEAVGTLKASPGEGDVYYWEARQDAEKYAEQYLTASSCFDFEVEEEID
jgi:hypothetical protein